ncbi:MAG: metabolite traffic protein EboE [Planctomycetes bacterium]|nr:metabolite traffic protein EboE [Planctomycetota bacterium]
MLGYCTNVHAGETIDEVIANLHNYASAVQHQVGSPIEVGLWLPATSLCEQTSVKLKECLETLNLRVRSFNGFPFGNFHDTIVGRAVYEPNWCEEERLTYTQQLATLLSRLLPENKSGSISTLPLGWGEGWDGDQQAAKMLVRCIDFLEDIEQTSQQLIHLDIEPEPGCRLQTACDLAEFIQKQFGDEERVRRYIRVCYDTCHGAVMRENPQDSLNTYSQVGLSIGKVQLSSAIDVDFDLLSQEERVVATEALRSLAEPRYLHQTTVVRNGVMEFYNNLSNAPLDDPVGHWRVHFHVPIHNKTFGPLGTTQTDLIQSLHHLPVDDATQLEVETYTWDVMPSVFQENELINSIALEICWANEQLNQVGKDE